VVFAPDGAHLLRCGKDKTVRCWRLGDGKEEWQTKTEDDVFVLAFSPDGSLLISGSRDKTLRIWKTKKP
jgi:WD40 repeat protein